MSKIKDLLTVTKEDIANVRNHYQKSETDLQQDVTILKEWLRQQPHLPNDEDDVRLESIFLKNKCRLEQTKRKLDKCYSFQVLYPEMMDMYDIYSVKIQNARNSTLFVPLPKLTAKQERVFCFKVINADTFQGLESVLYTFMFLQLCHTYDYSLADIYIIDWDGLSFKAMMTYDPNIIGKFGNIFSGFLSGRFASLHYINTPSYISFVMPVLKANLKPKFLQKINFTSLETLRDIFPQDMLPIEYGGKEMSIYKLHDEWGKELQHQTETLSKISKRISDEELRIGKLEESDLFGADGSFKNINLD